MHVLFKPRALTLGVALALHAIPFVSVHAQTAQLQPISVEGQSVDDPRVPQVTTATRTQTPARYVPQAIGSVKVENVQSYGVSTLGEALSAFPTSPARRTRASIRCASAASTPATTSTWTASATTASTCATCTISSASRCSGPGRRAVRSRQPGRHRQPRQQGAAAGPRVHAGSAGRQLGPAQLLRRPERGPQRQGQRAPERGPGRRRQLQPQDRRQAPAAGAIAELAHHAGPGLAGAV